MYPGGTAGEAVRWVSEYCASREVPVKVDPDGARELVDALGGDMMMISNELEKLMLYVGAKNRITLGRRPQRKLPNICWPFCEAGASTLPSKNSKRCCRTRRTVLPR